MISKYYFLLKEPGLLGEVPDPWFGTGNVKDSKEHIFKAEKKEAISTIRVISKRANLKSLPLTTQNGKIYKGFKYIKYV